LRANDGSAVSFVKRPTRPTRAAGRFLPREAALLLLRVLLLGVVAIGGALWGLERHFTQKLPPWQRPVAPRSVPALDVDAGELPAPDLVEGDGG
jgi:hypothetical protein